MSYIFIFHILEYLKNIESRVGRGGWVGAAGRAGAPNGARLPHRRIVGPIVSSRHKDEKVLQRRKRMLTFLSRCPSRLGFLSLSLSSSLHPSLSLSLSHCLSDSLTLCLYLTQSSLSLPPLSV